MPERPQTSRTKPPRRPAKGAVRLRVWWPKRRWVRITALVIGIPMVVGVITACYLWVSYGRMIDARLGGEQRAIPRIFGRPFEMRPGRALEPGQLVQRLNDVGYAERPKATQPGEFSVAAGHRHAGHPSHRKDTVPGRASGVHGRSVSNRPADDRRRR
jgi:hypothetical protein